MCLAISSCAEHEKGWLASTWFRVAKTPLRLFTFGAAFHFLIFAGILFLNSSGNIQIVPSLLLSGFSFGILALPVFGYLMTWMPRAYSLSPVHYGRYNSVYIFVMVSLLLSEYGLLYNVIWMKYGLIFLIPGWLIALQGLLNMHIWIASGEKHISKSLLVLLYLNFSLLACSAPLQFFDVLITDIMLILSLLLIWPIILVVITILVKNASNKGRIVSV